MTDAVERAARTEKSFWESTREITHHEAEAAADRLICSLFKNDGERARVSIPARPDHDDDLVIKSYIRQRRRASTAPETPAPSVPDGWKLVPVEPTGAMKVAGGEALSQSIGSWGEPSVSYRAMLAAAPEPPVQEPLTMSMFTSRADLEAEREKRAQAAQPVSSEPVAWLYTVRGDAAEFMRISRQYVDVTGDIVAVMPLYTHPAPVKEAVEALREAKDNLLDVAARDIESEASLTQAYKQLSAALASLTKEQAA